MTSIGARSRNLQPDKPSPRPRVIATVKCRTAAPPTHKAPAHTGTYVPRNAQPRPMSRDEAQAELRRHQPTSNGVTYEDDCATCGRKYPCQSRRDAEAAWARHNGARPPSMRGGFFFDAEEA